MITEGKPQQQDRRTFQLERRLPDQKNKRPQFSSSTYPLSRSPLDISVHISDGLCHFKFSNKKIPHRSAQQITFQLILDSVKLTNKISRLSEHMDRMLTP